MKKSIAVLIGCILALAALYLTKFIKKVTGNKPNTCLLIDARFGSILQLRTPDGGLYVCIALTGDESLSLETIPASETLIGGPCPELQN